MGLGWAAEVWGLSGFESGAQFDKSQLSVLEVTSRDEDVAETAQTH